MSIFDPLWGRLRRADAPPRETRHRSAFVEHALAEMGSGEVAVKAPPSMFHRNPIVYRCVRMIAEACASIPLLVSDAQGVCLTHPLITLLARPNPHGHGGDMRDMLVSHLLLHGNAYIEMLGGETVEALYILSPSHMRLQRDASGWPSRFDYAAGGKTQSYAAGPGSPIIHLKLTDPSAARAIRHRGCHGTNPAGAVFMRRARPSAFAGGVGGCRGCHAALWHCRSARRWL